MPAGDHAATGGPGHDHATGERSVRRLGQVAALNLVGFVAELAGGLAFGSVALVGDAFHMLFDALAYLLALGAAYVSAESEPGEYWSYGLGRVEPFAAFLNGVLLVPMVGYLVWESYRRYLDPVDIDPVLTAVLAAGGLLVNVGSVYLLQGGEMTLNERGAYYHLLGDTGASVAVIASMLVIEVTGVRVVDPLAAVLIAGIIVWSAVELLRESGEIFFQRSPVSVDEVETRLRELEGVSAVEDIHVWRLSSTLTVATMHLRDSLQSAAERAALKERIAAVLHEEYGIDHTTVDTTPEDVDLERRTEHG